MLARAKHTTKFLLKGAGLPTADEETSAGREFNVALLELPELQYLPPADVSAAIARKLGRLAMRV